MPRLKRCSRKLIFGQRPSDVEGIEPTEQDETDHLIEEWINEALSSGNE